MEKKKIRLFSILILFTVIVISVSALCVLSVKTSASDLKAAQTLAATTSCTYTLESMGARRLTEINDYLHGGALPGDTEIVGNEIRSFIVFENRRLEIKLTYSGTSYKIVSWKNYAVRSEEEDQKLFGA